jgi:endonuclease YncB( thermonuclease family)
VFLALLGMVALALRQAGVIEFSGERVRVIDGDSLVVDGTETRLTGIDAPEYRQDCRGADGRIYGCGRLAADTLRRLVEGAEVTCSSHDTDRYGRAVAQCRTGSTDIASEMVRLGWAIAIREEGIVYLDEEREAKAAKRGMWRGRFETPSAWRARNRE